MVAFDYPAPRFPPQGFSFSSKKSWPPPTPRYWHVDPGMILINYRRIAATAFKKT